MWTEGAMARRIDWERRRFNGRRTTSIKDEKEFRKGDLAAKWIAKAEEKLAAEKEKPLVTERRSN